MANVGLTLPLGNGTNNSDPTIILNNSTVNSGNELSGGEDEPEDFNERVKRKYIKGRKLGEGTYANVFLGYVREATGADEPDDLNERTKRKYIKDRKLGEGTYANVYLGHLQATPTAPPRPVAIKKTKINTQFRDGLSMDAIREVKYLRELRHPNIVALLDVFSSKGQNLNMVLEYLESDLEMIIKDGTLTLSMAHVKSWMLMSLRALWWCHRAFILHRDIKPNNLLLATNGQLKLADFGLARSFSDPYRAMTSNVITRWYRPPELLFGAKYYSSAVDVFSLGLVFCELMLRVPFLPGNNDIHQLELICSALGTPTEENWPGVTSLPSYCQPSVQGGPVKERGRDFFSSTFFAAGESGVDLLMKMIRLDPRKRCSAREALDSKWFAEEPRPTKPELLPKKGGGKGIEKVGSDLKRKAGELSNGTDGPGRGKKVARKLDFNAEAKRG